jgi:hypothetical protein
LRLLAVLLVALALPSAALAQSPGNPLSPGLPQPQATIPTATTPAQPVVPQVTNTTGASSGGLGGSGVVAIAIGALVVLGGISYFIWWDARKRAPVRARAAAIAAGDPGRRAGSKARAKPRKLSPAERRRRKRGRAR